MGAGFAGSVLAERLAHALDLRVLVVEQKTPYRGQCLRSSRRCRLTRFIRTGRTSSTPIPGTCSTIFAIHEWRHYEHRVLASVDGNWCRSRSIWIRSIRLYGLNPTAHEMEDFLENPSPRSRTRQDSEDVVVNRVGRDLYEKFFRGYTRKQWGLDPSELDASVTVASANAGE